ncbi:MucR family transcriptional regulator [Pseudochelatococcus lubricantis]|uniref:MucR family transcriptional regulator n=1 Tax=Pseudochelatococcus lubricantis TaxID=1538102 RepID=UPI0035EE4541
MSEAAKSDLTALTVQLLSAYVANNAVPSTDLADLIRKTRAALAEGGEVETVSLPEQPRYIPAVPVHTSLISRDHIFSLIDGKPYKSLKRHLSSHGLTPAEYRARYDLPDDYPLVAPAYSEERREVARKLGLGRRKGEAGSEQQRETPVAIEPQVEVEVTPSAEQAAPEPAPAPKRTTRGREAVASEAPAAPRVKRTRKAVQVDAE